MRGFVCRTLAGVALGAVAACNSPKVPYLITGDAAAVTPGTHADALWMIALPPVTVYARRPARPARDSVATR